MRCGLWLLPRKGLCLAGCSPSVKERAAQPPLHSHLGASIAPAGAGWGKLCPLLFRVTGGTYTGFYLQYVRLSPTQGFTFVWAVKGRKGRMSLGRGRASGLEKQSGPVVADTSLPADFQQTLNRFTAAVTQQEHMSTLGTPTSFPCLCS